MLIEATNIWTLVLSGLPSALLLYYWVKTKPDTYPPGPIALPIIGNVHQIFMAGSVVKFCEGNRKKFGNVSIKMFGGESTAIIIQVSLN